LCPAATSSFAGLDAGFSATNIVTIAAFLRAVTRAGDRVYTGTCLALWWIRMLH
jgi:hypothetical protein